MEAGAGGSGVGRALASWLATHQVGLSLLLLLGWTEETAWRLRGDASYDLLNYHLYGPFALLHGSWGRDIAPAQSQGFLPPTNDVPYYLVVRHLGEGHLARLLLALPCVAALGFALLIALRLLRAETVTARLLALVAVVIGATGAATHPVLATSMSDMVPCTLVLGAMLLLLDDGRARHGLLAGLMLGAALGLKLTFTYAATGLVVALLARGDIPAVRRVGIAAWFCAGAALALLAFDGWWWWRLWRFSGNPVFPFYNNLFRSGLAYPGDFIDRRFFPRDTVQWLFYPFLWAVRRTTLVTELDQPMRDPRIALALLASLVLLARSFVVRCGDARFIGTFFLVSMVAWERSFSIFRYLSVLELLSGPILAMAALSLAPRNVGARRAVLAGSLLLLAGLRLVTVAPEWGRAPQSGTRALVSVPRLPVGALVLILDHGPLAYIAAFEPDGVRLAGVNNNLTQPENGGLMQARIRSAIAAAETIGVYGLDQPRYDPGRADRTLAAYRLRRADCADITGSIVWPGTRLCRLIRAAG